MIDRNKSQIIENERTEVISYPVPRTIWGAVFAGLVMVMVIQLTLALLGSAIGLSMVDPRSGADSLKEIGVGATIWWIISSLIAFFSGGWVAGRLAGAPRTMTGTLHGLLTWATTSVISFILLTGTLGAIIGGSFGLIKSGGQAVAGAAPEIAQTVKQNVVPQNLPAGNVMQSIEQDVEQLLSSQGASAGDSANARMQIMTAVGVFALAPQDKQAAAREQVANQLTTHTELSAAQARNTVDDWARRIQPVRQEAQQNIRRMGQEAGQAVETAGDVAATGALASFFMLLLGGIAAGWGGHAGTPHWSEEQIV